MFYLCSYCGYWRLLWECLSIAEYLAAGVSRAPQYIAVNGYCGRRMERRQTACKPGSVADLSARAMAIHLGRPSPGASRDRPGRQVRKPTCGRSWSRRVPPLLGLAPGGVCRAAPVTGRAVRSYRTLSPLLAGIAAPDERSPLCGTFPGVAPAGCYPAPCLRGARTFLRRAPQAATAAIRPSGPP